MLSALILPAPVASHHDVTSSSAGDQTTMQGAWTDIEAGAARVAELPDGLDPATVRRELIAAHVER
ncbi:hypothetical protein [Sanguibacter suaedae]|uniref:Uncharacterized protein n=1 Tax=Sanguibacter suaedae TaxID=2795737 RepID=A0A934M9R9_9MICO|nr:hypothetical protein [Sanguibacter suaedae]MBI9114880.1 hypothetical protein [Sanguibacter suaedae]